MAPGSLPASVRAKADRAVDRLARERLGAAVEGAPRFLRAELALDGEAHVVALDAAVDRGEVVADGRAFQERDVDGPVDGLDAALLQRALEADAHVPVDGRGAGRSFLVRQLDRAVDGV